MPGRHIITSKKGKIEHVEIYFYQFSENLLQQTNQKDKFCKWLTASREIVLFEINQNGFSTFLPLSSENNWQYNLKSIDKLNAPFNNTTQISELVSRLIKNCYQKTLQQFLNKNIFIIEEIELFPFKLLKCFQFNIEFFADGSFFIHFSPISKLINDKILNIEYIRELDAKFNNADSEMKFNLVGQRGFKRIKLYLKESDIIEKTKSFLEFHGGCSATFDYHFLSNYDKNIFTQVTELTINKLSEAIAFLLPLANNLSLPSFIKLNSKPFSEIQIVPLLNPNNLLVGNNSKVNQQKAAFYNGMFKPVNDKIIQPIGIDGYDTSEFRTLLNNHFNKNGTAEVYPTMEISSSLPIDLQNFIQLKALYGGDILFPIFTKYKLPNDFLKPLLNLGIKYQIISGIPNSSQLSNFAVKCLEKLGGLLSAINNLYEPETTYFIGIDMGHTTNNDENFSNLCMAIFDNKGCFLTHKVIAKIKKNEALDLIAVGQCLDSIKKNLNKMKLPLPQKIIIHRDGKVHLNDVTTLLSQLTNRFGDIKVDILEIIKSGYPVIANYLNNEYHNLKSGEYWMIKEQKYAILVTNIQADQNRLILNPIVIKQKYGITDFANLVEQVYWFTKIYTNNLYNSTRLPATTERANNFVSTSNKEHRSTYLA